MLVPLESVAMLPFDTVGHTRTDLQSYTNTVPCTFARADDSADSDADDTNPHPWTHRIPYTRDPAVARDRCTPA